MPELINILTLKNQVEASLMESILKENNIPYIIKSFYDSAYDGIYQMQYGWGIIQAKEEFKDDIIKLYNELIKNNY